MNISFTGFNENSVTFICSEDVTTGKVVKVTDNGTVSVCANGDIFCGIATDVRSDCATVQLTGYTRISYSGSAPSLGYTALVADGNGAVTANDNGKVYLVTDVDTTDNTVGFML